MIYLETYLRQISMNQAGEVQQESVLFLTFHVWKICKFINFVLWGKLGIK